MNRLFCFILCLFVCYGFVVSAEPKFVVVIDPGHGGRDGGATRGIYREKTINLGVAKALGELIEVNNKDVKVVYTRSTDIFVDLDKRTKIANKVKANLFISIHTNATAAKTTTASGASSYILGLAKSDESLAAAKRENSVILLEDNYKTKYEGFDPNSPESYIIFEFISNKYMEQSLQLANFIQKDFKNIAKRDDRGVRQAGFLVLRKTSMPSVLIELGFINNGGEAKFLSSQSGQKTMARAIYSGFKKYKNDFDKKQGRQVATPSDKDVSDVDIVVENLEDTIEVEVKNPSEKIPAVEIVEYRVQFLISPQKLPTNSASFKGLSPVGYYKDSGGYKYTYGSTTDINEIIRIQKSVKAKFKDAFVVKIKDGKRVK